MYRVLLPSRGCDARRHIIFLGGACCCVPAVLARIDTGTLIPPNSRTIARTQVVVAVKHIQPRKKKKSSLSSLREMRQG